MIYYSKWLLGLLVTFTLSLMSLCTSQVHAYTSNDPAKLSGSVTASQSGQTVAITYHASSVQKPHPIYHAVWSEENGQDDIKWYRANENTTPVNLMEHRNYGIYHIHTYIDIKGKFVALNGASLTVKQPPLTSSITIPETGFVDIQLNNVPNTSSEIFIPTWSDQTGQDDIRWYSASKTSDGSYALRIFLKDHAYDQGIYHVHIYARNAQTGQLHNLMTETTKITAAHLPTSAELSPTLTIEQVNLSQGTYQVKAQETQKSKAIKFIDLASWSDSNQSNLKWYRFTSDRQGQFRTEVNLRNHQALSGHYSNHVYITYTDGSQSGHVLETLDFSSFHLPVSMSTNYIGNSQWTIDIHHLYEQSGVLYAVWSDLNGQDDIKWYDANRLSTGSFKTILDLRKHKGSGLYHIHVYHFGTRPQLRATSTFMVSDDMLPQVTAPSTVNPTINHQNNLYPIGQCTWGVKGLATWVSNYWGNANQWHHHAEKQGFQIGATPRAGAVAVWPRDGLINGIQYGHVAYVTHVESDSKIQVMESNYAGKQYIGNFRGWFNPKKIWQGGQLVDSPVYYIYPKS